MNTAVINLKVEPKLKSQAHEVADELGFSLSSIINAYLKHLVKTRAITFYAPKEDKLSDYAIKEINHSLNDYKDGKYVSFDSLEKNLNYLDKIIADDIKS